MSENGEREDLEEVLREEEKLVDEAKELVEHAASLVESKYYDDAIGILRKAISLYDQIGLVDEIQAVKEKIDEIYVLKEKEFREVDIQEVKIPDGLVISYLDKEELIEKPKEDFSYTAEELIEEAESLIEIDEYDEAIEKYDDAIKLYKKVNNDAEIEKIYKLIDECYDAKAEFLKRPKEGIETEIEETVLLEESAKLRKEREEKEKLQKVAELEKKKAEEEDFQKRIDDMVTEVDISIREYERGIREGNFDLEPPFENAIKTYEEIREMFKDKDWKEQIIVYTNQIKLTKQKLEKDRKLREIESQKREKDKAYQESLKVKRIEGADVEKARKVKEKRKEDDEFQAKIEKMVTEVDISIREYERGIREGNFDLEPPFENAIKAYEEIKDLLIKKDWKKEAMIYVGQVKLYQEKLEKDNKLREIEKQKREKDKAYQESLKVKRIEGAHIDKARAVEEKHKEDDDFQAKIDEMVTEVGISIREYDRAIREGNFDIEPPYENAIKIYEEIREMLKDKDWKEQIIVYTNQIKLTKQKLEKDRKLREIESQKREKDKDYQESLKAKKIDGVDIDKARKVEEKRKEDDDFQAKIDEMLTKVDKTIREYDRAIREGNFDVEPPYENAIKIYEEVRDMLQDKGWTSQTAVYIKQINITKQKLEKDKKLREVEGEKGEKDKKYLESLKIRRLEGLDIEKARELEDKRKVDKEFQAKIDDMVDKADISIREYERAIREGNFDLEPPYEKAIEIYGEVREWIQNRGWHHQSNVFLNQINSIKKKLEQDKKLREVEVQKGKSQEEFEKFKKQEVTLHAGMDRLKALEEKYREDEIFQQKINDLVNVAEGKAREYDMEIRKGNFDIEPPFDKIITIYEEARDMLKDIGWNDQIPIYIKQINITKQRLEADKKLREIEMAKVQKQKEYEASLKAKKEDMGLKADLDKIKYIEDRYKEELEEEEFENQITALVDKADEMVRKYELAIRYGQFEQECIYPKVIEIYEEISKRLLVKGWKRESMIYKDQIKLYQDKLEQDKKLREIEEQKRKRDLAYLESLKARKEAGIDVEKLKKIKEKAKDDEFFQQEIDRLATQAKKSLKNYELAIRHGNFEAEPPFEEVIRIYSDIRDMLREREWHDEATIFINQLNLIKQKQENDEKLREIEARKLPQQKEFDDQFKIKTTEPIFDFQRLKELELKEKDKELLINEAFRLIDEAEKLVKKYEYTIKTDILQTESPYEGIIEMYKAARKIFLENKWEAEASQLISTIKYYKGRNEKDEKLRAIEARKLARDKIPLIAPSFKPKKTILEREQMILELEKEKQEKEELSSQTFKLIDEAEQLAKNYEFKLKEGIFIDCPYEQIIEMYRNAKKQFQEIGWEDQSSKLISTINYYKEKLEKDNKLRELEKEKIEKQKREMETKRHLAEKARKEKDTFRKEKEKAILLKSKEISPFETQKDHAFRLMDQAKYQFNLNNFDMAITLYRESENIFSEINWPAGIKLIRDSIDLIRKKQQEFEFRQKVIKEKDDEALRAVKDVEEKAAKADDLIKLQQEQKRRGMLHIQEQKQKEKESSDRAFDLLEQGTMLVKRKKFEEAHNKFITARDIFKQIGWLHEVSQINNELLLNLTKEEKKLKRLEDYKFKKKKEKKEMETLLQEAEKQKQEIEKMGAKEKRKKLLKIQVVEQLKEKIKDKVKDANIDIIKFKYNNGIIKFKDAIKLMEKLEWKAEIAEIEKQIYVLKNKSLVPLITLKEFDKNENMEGVKLAYEALDNAQMSLLKNRFMKAVSELNEAVFKLKETVIGAEYISDIETKIKEYREELDKKRQIVVTKKEVEDKEEGEELSADLAHKYMEKCKKAEKRLRFEKAIEFAVEAKNVFSKLGSEFNKEVNTIEKYIDTLERKKEERIKLFETRKEEIETKEVALKKEEDDFKGRIAARGEERRKRIKDLMEKK